MDSNIVKLKDYTLKKFDTLFIQNDANVFKSKWKGYQWSLIDSDSSLLMPRNISEFPKIDITICKFIVGFFENQKLTYLHITIQETKKGIQVRNYDIPIAF